MSTSANLGLTHLSENQAQAYVLVNEVIDEFDDFAGRVLATSTKTGTASWTKTDSLFLCNHSAAIDLTLPPVSGADAPRPGQRFSFVDISSAGAGANNITLRVPSGAKLDGATNGTGVFAGDRAWAVIVFVDSSTGYRIIRCKHLLDSTDQIVTIRAWQNHAVFNNAAIALPTGGNHTPGYHPFNPTFPVSVDQVIFVFGTALPSSDASDANVRVWFHAGSTSGPGVRLFSGATQDIKLQGTGHVRDTTKFLYSHPGSISYAVAPGTLAARRFFDEATLYYMGYHLQSTFSAGNGQEVARAVGGMVPVLLSAGGQAWPYSPADNPTVAQGFGSAQLSRLEFLFRYRRLIER
jgi:hypothetical protein